MHPPMPDPSPQFTGLFIPAPILLNPKLTNSQIIFLAWIDALQDEKAGGCYASNAYFSERMGLTERNIQLILAQLIDLGFVERLIINERRILKSLRFWENPVAAPPSSPTPSPDHPKDPKTEKNVENSVHNSPIYGEGVL